MLEYIDQINIIDLLFWAKLIQIRVSCQKWRTALFEPYSTVCLFIFLYFLQSFVGRAFQLKPRCFFHIDSAQHIQERLDIIFGFLGDTQMSRHTGISWSSNKTSFFVVYLMRFRKWHRREAKINNNKISLIIPHNILRLEILMYNSPFVNLF